MNSKLRDLILVAMIAAMMAATSWIAIPLGALPPITLQTLFVFIAGLLLQPRMAFLSMTIYLIIGLVMPVYAGGNSGLATLFGPTGGFLIGFPITALLISFLKNKIILIKGYVFDSLVLMIGLIVLYVCGISYYAVYTGVSVFALIAPFSVFIPGDILKAFAAFTVYVSVSTYVKYSWA